MSRRPTTAAAAAAPDWCDIGEFMRELDRVHHITTSFKLEAGPGFYVGCVQVTLVASAPKLIGPGITWSAEFRAGFPNHQHRTLEALIYNLLHRLDAKAGRELWEQKSFA